MIVDLLETERLWFGSCIGFVCIGLLDMGESPLHTYCSELPLYGNPEKDFLIWQNPRTPIAELFDDET
ncbi:hypothetical protein LES19_14585, partial [Pseudomonas aeruginosa]|uniref:hypothetical protein n=1 Tax=Pseudomonas aeruginosa TaxID=287 RepID=UPI0038923400